MAAWWCLLAFVAALVAIQGSQAIPLYHEPNITVISEVYEDNEHEYAEGMYEGDIDLDDDPYSPQYRVAMLTNSRLWENGIVPYRIESTYSSEVAQMFRDTFTELQNELRSGNNYCVRFVERTTESDYVYIRDGSGCSSKIGRSGGAQTITLSSSCFYTGTVKHEMIHAIGFWHEQSRVDRDTYVTVMWDNIRAGKEGNFELHDRDGDTQGLPYDYLSVMHYDAYDFQEDKSLPTLVARQRGVIMGQRRGISQGNVREIQMKYGCAVDTSNSRSPTLPREGSVFDCHFESDMCGMTNEGSFNWVRRAGPTPTSGTGPTADRTSGNGYYLYVEASGHINEPARIFYPGELDAGVYCIMFQYWVYGDSDMQPLSVGAEASGRRQIMINISYSGKNYWRRTKLTLNVPITWRLFFEVTPTTEMGDIAIDDMELFPDGCPDYEK